MTPAGGRMCPLGWLGVASLCLGTLWAVPAKERRKADKPKAELNLYENLDLDNYDLTLDNYGEILDLSNYEELYDYGDLVPKVRGAQESPWVHPRTGIWSRGRMWHRRTVTALAALPVLGKVLPEPNLCQLFVPCQPFVPCQLFVPCQRLDVRIPSSLWARRGEGGVPWRAFQEGINNPDPNLPS